MCEFCDKNIVIIPDEGPQLDFGLKTGKFGDLIKLSINHYRKTLDVEIDKYQHPAIVDTECFMHNMGFKHDWPEFRWASWKIKYCPFCGKKLNNDEE